MSTPSAEEDPRIEQAAQLGLVFRPAAARGAPSAAAGAAPKLRGLAVVFTFYNSKPKHVVKYGAEFTEQGLDVVGVPQDQFIPNIKVFDKRLGALLDFINEIYAEAKPPMVAFGQSMGGLYHLFHWYNLVHSDQHPQYRAWRSQLVGCIIDSAPGNWSARAAARAATEHTRNRLLRWTTRQIVWVRMVIFMHVILRNDEFKKYRDFLETVEVPALFLYSHEDLLCERNAVEATIAGRIHRDLPTKSVLFANSPHVMHFVLDAPKYRSAVVRQLGELLGGVN